MLAFTPNRPGIILFAFEISRSIKNTTLKSLVRKIMTRPNPTFTIRENSNPHRNLPVTANRWQSLLAEERGGV